MFWDKEIERFVCPLCNETFKPEMKDPPMNHPSIESFNIGCRCEKCQVEKYAIMSKLKSQVTVLKYLKSEKCQN